MTDELGDSTTQGSRRTAVCVLLEWQEPYVDPEGQRRAQKKWVEDALALVEARGGAAVRAPEPTAELTDNEFKFEIIHTDGARRAVVESLEILELTDTVGSESQGRFGLAARIGISSGLRDETEPADLARAAEDLAKGAEPGRILLSERAYEPEARFLLVDRLDEPVGALRLRKDLVDKEALVGEQETTQGSENGDEGRHGGLLPSLELALAVLGAIAGLAAWVAVVGGLTMWGRFTAAGVPPGEAVSLLPRELLIAEGLRTLAVPLALGLAAAALAYLAERRGAKSRARYRWARFRTRSGHSRSDLLAFVGRHVGLVALSIVLVILLTTAVYWLFEVKFGWALTMVVVTLLAVGGAFALFAQKWRPAMLVLSAFTLAAVWSGTIGFLNEFGARKPGLQTADVELRGTGEHVYGLYVARTGDAVLVAQSDASDQDCGLRVVPSGDVETVLIGAPAANDFSDQEQCLPPPPPPSDDNKGVNGEATPERVVTETETVTSIVTDTETVFVEGETVTTTVPETPEDATSDDNEPLPEGAQPFGDGAISIPVSSVLLPEHLRVARVRFNQDPLSAGKPVTVTIWIGDTRGYRVRGAQVHVLGIRYGRFHPVSTVTSDLNGRAVLALRPTSRLVLGRGGRAGVLVRVWKRGEPIRAGVSARLVVQFQLAPESREP